MAINNFQISYPDFKLMDVINPDHFDANNADISSKLNQIIPVVNDTHTKSFIDTGLAGKTDKTGNHEGTWQGYTPNVLAEGATMNWVKDHGLGTGAKVVSNSDFNAIRNTGFYIMQGNTLNSPISLGTWAYLLHIKADDTNCRQLVWDFGSGAIYSRFQTTGTWGRWHRVGDDSRHVSIMQRRAVQWLPGNTWTRLRPDHVVTDDGDMHTVMVDTYVLKESGWYRFDFQGRIWLQQNVSINIDVWKVGEMDGIPLVQLYGSNVSTERWVTGSGLIYNTTPGTEYEFVGKQTNSSSHEIFSAQFTVMKL